MQSVHDDFLGFRLQPFVRVAWASRQLQAVGETALNMALAAYRQWLEDLLVSACLPAVLLQVAPWEVPALQRRMLFQGLSIEVLGPDNWLLPQDGLIGGHDAKRIWCLAGQEAALANAVWAWNAKHARRLRKALGQPDCCNDAHEHHDQSKRPEWATILGAAAQDWRTNYTLARLGLAPAPWLPCNSACPASASQLSVEPPEVLRAVLGWPVEWSALHGMGQVMTPYFKMVCDVPATGVKHVRRIGSVCQAPLDTPQGAVFPYLPLTRRPIQHTVSFQRGIAHAQRLVSGPIQLGRVREVSKNEVPVDIQEPISLPGFAQHWPALRRWTPEYLLLCMGQAMVQPRGGDFSDTEVTFADFLRNVVRDDKSAGYLLDFPFERVAPELQEDVDIPSWLRSWHEDLPLHEQPELRSLYLGATGTGSPLHVDILNTSAWNVVIWGRKEWIICPPTSDARLLVNEPDLFDPAEQHRLSRRGLDIRLCSQKPGDLLFVPHGWWHQVRNAEPTLAVTANIVNHVNCSDVQRAVQEAQLPALQAVGGALSKAIAMHLIDIK